MLVLPCGGGQGIQNWEYAAEGDKRVWENGDLGRKGGTDHMLSRWCRRGSRRMLEHLKRKRWN